MRKKTQQRQNFWKSRKVETSKRNNRSHSRPKNKFKRKTTATKTRKPPINFPFTRISALLFKVAIIVGALFLLYAVVSKASTYINTLEMTSLKDIEVVGIENLTQDEIKAALPFKTGVNIFSIKLSSSQEYLMRNKPEIKSISMKRKFYDGGLSKIYVQIEERIPEAFIRNGASLKGIDFDSISFPLRGSMKDMNIPIITSKSDKNIREVLSFIKIIKDSSPEFFTKIKEIGIEANDITFVNEDGALVYWGHAKDINLEKKIEIFNRIYDDAKAKFNRIDYVDITFYNAQRVIIKPKSMYQKD
jgi:cell division septal protein FtsQ